MRDDATTARCTTKATDLALSGLQGRGYRFKVAALAPWDLTLNFVLQNGELS